ncbi:ATP-binding protein [uncultured Succinivibrio sp.]|uniref:ATP-binding protein n=1 Tax=uncultured Succinivibrio sp. TaxID=540749 RepID=UPI0025D6A0F4|nr:ATP-binding protein [uncultured Succinivibrio sp.]
MQQLERNTDGFRLHHVEIYNWGTFHHKIWTLELDGQNGLLTGEIGSGKSTMVDAITSLLVPSQKIVFNKAAGATSKERDLRSYVMGYYKSQSGEYGNLKPVALRPDYKDYSVILAVFHNEELKKAGHEDYDITLALAMFMSNAKAQPDKIFVTAEKILSIKEHFSDFGKDPSSLRRKLRQHKAEIFDSFPQYSAWWKRRFGIGDNDQAIELFAQTVSMKTVDNISSFVQSHMLQKVDTDEKIEDIIDRFNDLNSTYESVCKARDMMTLLEPMQETAQALNLYVKEMERYELAKKELDPYVGIKRRDLLISEIQSKKNNLEKHKAQLEALDLKNTDLEDELEKTREDRRKNGGEQLESLAKAIKDQEHIIAVKKERSKSYEMLLKLLDLNLPRSVLGFAEQKQKLVLRTQELEESHNSVQQEMIRNGAKKELLSSKIKEFSEDLEYIKAHPSNISVSQLKLRELICEELGINTECMPFVGELIEIKESEKLKWEGAIERVLHGFALSMLVPEAYYSEVLQYVDSHNLKGRLVYFKVVKDFRYSGKAPYPDELRSKLTLKDKGELTEFVRQHLDDNFAYICTEDYREFKREHKAITPQGQIKSGNRHEKDDRHSLNDRKNYVLGWSNTDKLMLLTKTLSEHNEELEILKRQSKDIKNRFDELQNTVRVFAKLEDYKSYDEIDYLSQMEKLKTLNAEYQKIESGADIFRMLNSKIEQLLADIRELTEEKNELIRKSGNLEGEIDIYEKDLNAQNEELNAYGDNQIFSEELLDNLLQKALGDNKSLTLGQCSKVSRDINHELDRLHSFNRNKASAHEKKLITDMSAFNHRYEVETQEFDAAVQSWPQYEELLLRIKKDDLPRFESLFKKKLRDNTLNDVATLNAFLDTASSEITKRITVINKALKTIEYNPGRHIQLVTINSEDQEIKQFRFDLRQMIDNRTEIDTGSLQISEERFMRVKELIERFKGRQDSVEADRRWRLKVTDVRRWYEFAAQELYDADDSQYEYYKDSSGKSGGQKEKLAYTILATSLAYQFGTGFEDNSSNRSFRFVIIDEAFGRGSDDSANFGLKLFKKLKLQLLVVTPMQKISIIEPYVEHVAMVSKNELNSQSSVRNLTIKEYRLLKKQRELVNNTSSVETVL